MIFGDIQTGTHICVSIGGMSGQWCFDFLRITGQGARTFVSEGTDGTLFVGPLYTLILIVTNSRSNASGHRNAASNRGVGAERKPPSINGPCIGTHSAAVLVCLGQNQSSSA